jgi:hypothetical protein
MAKGGARAGAGNPGYGKLLFLKTKVEELSPLWFQIAEKMLKGKNAADRRFIMAELNKLQAKMIPQQLTGLDDGPIVLSWKSKSTTNPGSGQKVSISA